MANSINILKPSVCFEIQKIIAISTRDGNCRTYQVQWAPSWISGAHLIGCEDLIEEFEHDQDGKAPEIKEDIDRQDSQDGGGLVFNETTNDESPEGEQLAEHSLNHVNSNISGLPLNNYRYLQMKNRNVNNDTETMVSVVSQNASVDNCEKYVCKEAVHSNFQGMERSMVCNGEYSRDNFTMLLMQPDSGSNQDAENSSNSLGDMLILNSADQSHSETSQPPQTATYIKKECTTTDRVESNEELEDNNYNNRTETVKVKIKIPNKKGARGKTSKTKSEFEKTFDCDVCKKTFGTISNLKRHYIIHTTYPKEYRYKCSFCSKSFLRSADLKRHTRVHTGERPFECTICQSKFKIKHNLQRHLKTQHSKGTASMCDNDVYLIPSNQ